MLTHQRMIPTHGRRYTYINTDFDRLVEKPSWSSKLDGQTKNLLGKTHMQCNYNVLLLSLIIFDEIIYKNIDYFLGSIESLPEVEKEIAQAFAAAVKEGPKYKFGELVPRSVAHALAIDRANGNTDWQDSMGTELRQIKEYKTFRYLQKGESITDYKLIPYHFVFDIKFDGRKKSRLVAGGNKTNPPAEDLYSGVVDLMTIRMGHMIAKANKLLGMRRGRGKCILIW